MTLEDISIVRGDTDTVVVAFKDSCTGTAKDITGWTVWLTVRESVPDTSVTDDAGALISKSFTTGGTSGLATFSFSETDTNIDVNSHLYDIQYKDESNRVKTLGVAGFKITGDITRSA